MTHNKQNSKTAFSVQEADESAGLLLWQTTTLWQRNIKEALAPFGISHSQFVVLAVLRWLFETKQPSTQVQIVQFSKLDKMLISNTLKALLQKELVTRVECSKDTRVKEVSLTRKGQDLATQLIKVIEEVDDLFFGSLSAKEQQILKQLFIKMRMA